MRCINGIAQPGNGTEVFGNAGTKGAAVFAAQAVAGKATLQDTVRGDGGSRVETHPAFAVKPQFCPGVRRFFAHHPVAGKRVQFAALIADDHPRRYANTARRQHHRAGVVFAEADAVAEEECFRVARAGRWFKRVVVFFFM